MFLELPFLAPFFSLSVYFHGEISSPISSTDSQIYTLSFDLPWFVGSSDYQTTEYLHLHVSQVAENQQG